MILVSSHFEQDNREGSRFGPPPPLDFRCGDPPLGGYPGAFPRRSWDPLGGGPKAHEQDRGAHRPRPMWVNPPRQDKGGGHPRGPAHRPRPMWVNPVCKSPRGGGVQGGPTDCKTTKRGGVQGGCKTTQEGHPQRPMWVYPLEIKEQAEPQWIVTVSLLSALTIP